MHWDKCMIEAPHLLYVRSCTFYLDVFEAGHWQCFPFALWFRLPIYYMWDHAHFILMCLRRDIDMAHTIHWGRYVFEAPYTLHVMACMLLTWCVWGEALATVHRSWVIEALSVWCTGTNVWLRLPIYYMWDHAHFILMCLRRDIDSVSHSLCDWGMAHTIHWGQYMFEALYTLHVMACMLLTCCVWGKALATVHSSCVIEALSVWCTGTNVWLRLLKYYMWYHVHFILLCLRRDNDSVSHLLCDWGMAHTIHWSRYVFEAPYILHVMACMLLTRCVWGEALATVHGSCVIDALSVWCTGTNVWLRLLIYYIWDHVHFILMCLRRDIDSVSHSLCDWGMAHTIHWSQYMFEALYTLHVMACMLLTWCVWGEALATVHSSCVIEALSVWCTGTNVWLRLLKYYMWYHVHFILLCLRRDNDSVSHLLCDWGMAHTIHWSRYVFEAPYILHVMACMLLTRCVWGEALATVHGSCVIDALSVWCTGTNVWLRLLIYYIWDHVHFILMCLRRDIDSVSHSLCDWGMAHTIHWSQYMFEALYTLHVMACMLLTWCVWGKALATVHSSCVIEALSVWCTGTNVWLRLLKYYMWYHVHFILLCLRRDNDSVSHLLCDWGMAHTIHWSRYVFGAPYILHVMACMLLTRCVWGEALATVHGSCVIDALSVWCTGTNVWLRLLIYYIWDHVHFILMCLRRDIDSVSHSLCDWGMAHTIHWSQYMFEALYTLHVMACMLLTWCVWGKALATVHSSCVIDWGTVCMMHWDKCMIEAPHILYVRSCTCYLVVCEARQWQCFPFTL